MFVQAGVVSNTDCGAASLIDVQKEAAVLAPSGSWWPGPGQSSRHQLLLRAEDWHAIPGGQLHRASDIGIGIDNKRFDSAG